MIEMSAQRKQRSSHRRAEMWDEVGGSVKVYVGGKRVETLRIMILK